jgi:hypothetical protein
MNLKRVRSRFQYEALRPKLAAKCPHANRGHHATMSSSFHFGSEHIACHRRVIDVAVRQQACSARGVGRSRTGFANHPKYSSILSTSGTLEGSTQRMQNSFVQSRLLLSEVLNLGVPQEQSRKETNPSGRACCITNRSLRVRLCIAQIIIGCCSN